ncbi:MAG TPA: TraB/GumN family protein [Candidatus Limiplasma sp.]|nr:TraB/GumN family protein [Candidatus Limiplasma sp.]HPS80584.1 TraB/GumN family protein [Candidatus Limiplasma sp.]
MNKKRWVWAVGIAAALLAGALAFGLFHTGEGSRGVLYRVSNGKAQMYLLGSIHVGSRDMYPFGDAIERAMAAADTFVYECDTTNSDAVAEMKRQMALTDGQTLQTVLGDDLYAQVAQVGRQQGLNMETLDGLKPWAVVNTLAVYTTAAEMGTANVNEAMALGVERQVEAYAEQHGKKTAFLETLREQTDVLEGFSDALQRYLLQSECEAILHPETIHGMDQTIAEWPEWWRAGNVEAFAESYLSTYLEPGYETVCGEYHRKLITQRNLRMADSLATLLAGGGDYFVTVGLLHLALPEDSIIAALRQKGYQVELVSNP